MTFLNGNVLIYQMGTCPLAQKMLCPWKEFHKSVREKLEGNMVFKKLFNAKHVSRAGMRGQKLLVRESVDIDPVHKEAIIVTSSYCMRANQLHSGLEALAPQSVAHRIAELYHLGPSPHLLNQNLHFHKANGYMLATEMQHESSTSTLDLNPEWASL